MRIPFKRPTTTTFIVLVFLLSTGISCKDQKESNSVKVNSHTPTDQSPCEVLTDAEIKNALAIPENTETSKRKSSTTYPVCYYKWESITYPYEVMDGYMADHPAELSIVWATNVNKKLYEQSISVYKDGEKINDVGEMATWSQKMGQITFLKNGNLIHVKAKIVADAASNKAKSLKVAKLFAENL